MRFGVCNPHVCPPRNSHLPRFRSSQYSRMRFVWLLDVTNTLPGSLPLKSNSTYPVTSFLPNLVVVLMLKREYWPVERYSVRWPCTVLLYGIAPKLVAATLPVLVVRKMFSKSTNPPGVKSAAPILKDSGLLAPCASGCCGCVCISAAVRAAAVAVLLEVLKLASTRRGDIAAPPLLFSFLFKSSSCCCCLVICCWFRAIFSRRALSSFATEGVPLDPLLSFVGAWPKAKPDANKRKQRFFDSVIRFLSFSALRQHIPQAYVAHHQVGILGRSGSHKPGSAGDVRSLGDQQYGSVLRVSPEGLCPVN